VRHNAVRHGLLAKQISFRYGEVRQQEFKQFLDELEQDLKPIGMIEKISGLPPLRIRIGVYLNLKQRSLVSCRQFCGMKPG
jgi:hypothetical protein